MFVKGQKSFTFLNSYNFLVNMPKIKKEEANESDFWMWSQTYEDATADLNWCGENLEQTDKK